MSLADMAAQKGLKRVGARPPFGVYMAEVWRRRQFIYSLAKFRIESENQRNRLGMGWIVLKPTLNAVVYGVIFGFLMAASRPPNFVQFIVIGIFMFEFFSTTFSNGAKSITSNNALVQSLSFPRMSLPLSAVTQHFLQFLPSVAIMLVLNLIMGATPQWHWILLVPLIALYFIFNAGVALITARLTVHFRDLSQLLPFVTRVAFYTSGVFFSIERIAPNNETILRIFDFIPLHEFMSIARGLLIEGADYEVNPMYWLYATVWSVLLLTVGAFYFWAAEERYGRND